NNGKLELAGMTIGIGMNQKDYYQKEQYGATYSTTISKEKRIEEGKIAAKKVLARVRQKVGNNVPIVIAMFAQAPNDSLVDGYLNSYTVSKRGTDISSWIVINIMCYVVPAIKDNKILNDNDSTSFYNFQKEFNNFFPNNSYVKGQGQ